MKWMKNGFSLEATNWQNQLHTILRSFFLPSISFFIRKLKRRDKEREREKTDRCERERHFVNVSRNSWWSRMWRKIKNRLKWENCINTRKWWIFFSSSQACALETAFNLFGIYNDHSLRICYFTFGCDIFSLIHSTILCTYLTVNVLTKWKGNEKL